MEVEQRCGIDFFSHEGIPAVQIVGRLRYHYRKGELSRTQVYFWISLVERGRTNLKTTTRPGRNFDEGIGAVIAGKLDADPHPSVRKLAQSLGTAASTLCPYFTEDLEMKCQHLHWIPHTLTPKR
jgi:hypothetical protein